MSSLPKTVTRQRRDCDLNPGPSAPESQHANQSATEPPWRVSQIQQHASLQQYANLSLRRFLATMCKRDVMSRGNQFSARNPASIHTFDACCPRDLGEWREVQLLHPVGVDPCEGRRGRSPPPSSPGQLKYFLNVSENKSSYRKLFFTFRYSRKRC